MLSRKSHKQFDAAARVSSLKAMVCALESSRIWGPELLLCEVVTWKPKQLEVATNSEGPSRESGQYLPSIGVFRCNYVSASCLVVQFQALVDFEVSNAWAIMHHVSCRRFVSRSSCTIPTHTIGCNARRICHVMTKVVLPARQQILQTTDPHFNESTRLSEWLIISTRKGNLTSHVL